MDLYASDDFRTKIGRWRRTLGAISQKALKAAPTVCLLGGAALGLIYSFEAESWITVGFFTVLGALLGRALVLAARFVRRNLVGFAALVAGVLLMIAGVVIAAIVVMTAIQLVILGVRSLLGI